MRNHLPCVWSLVLVLSKLAGGLTIPLKVPADCLESSIRNRVAYQMHERWRQKNPVVSDEILKARQEKLLAFMKCGPEAVPVSSGHFYPTSSSSAHPPPDIGPPPPQIDFERPNPKLLDLARCISRNGKYTSHSQTCREDFDPTAPPEYPAWDPRFELQSAGLEGVVLDVDACKGALGDAIFIAKAIGPTTMQVVSYQHLEKLRFRFKFVPVELGEHVIHIRIEHLDGAATLVKNGGDAPPAEYVGLDIPGSPFKVNVQESNKTVDKSSMPIAVMDLPICKGADRPGLWRNLPSPDNEDLFQPALTIGGCPKCDNVDTSVHPKRCSTGVFDSKRRLADGGVPDWSVWDSWTGRDCRYCRFSRDKALNCLDNKRITLVGDSVSMQLCSYLQCAYHGGSGCSIACEHRMRSRGVPKKNGDVPCFETQTGAGPVYCVSFDNFLGTPFQGAGGARGYAIMKGQTDSEVESNVRLAMQRSFQAVPGEALENVLIIGAGLHDNAFSNIDFPSPQEDTDQNPNPILRMFRVLVRVGFSRIIYVLPTAVHRYTSWSTDCSHLKQLMSPTCMQYVQRYLSNSRTHRLHNLTRAAIEAIRQETPHANIDILNPFPISELREDNTKTHADMVHYCSQFNREMTHVLLTMLCGHQC
mmetsp:Transcript_47891/g.89220  ORF Transcript_47891/g.89220 Transcript_47891/m.89220 type:complete len:644 (+) Transcript_47891:188-2119(+)